MDLPVLPVTPAPDAVPLSGNIRGKIRSFVLTETKALSDGSVRVSGYASTPNLDRVREIIDVSAYAGTLDVFKSNPIMLLQHDAERPIGKFDQFELRDDGLWLSGIIVPGTRASDEAITLVKAGVYRTFSVGFRELDGDFDANNIWHIKRLELLETSIVAIPANREAIFTMDGGKCVGIKQLPDEIESVTDDELVAEFRKRGLSAAAREPEAPKVDGPATPLVRAWRKGTCTGCGGEDLDVVPFAEREGHEWTVCARCFVAPVLTEDAVDQATLDRLDVLERAVEGLKKTDEALTTTIADNERIMTQALKREAQRLAREAGVRPASKAPAAA